jgi:hypothetical protein
MSKIAFKELFEQHQYVQIPMIQRDYAQGRESEKEVRDEFLDALYAALILPEGDKSLPLNLDFIYGSVDGNGVKRFLPLDGQQRLTTLFLLHWYLAWRDGCWEEFEKMFCIEGVSRFSYFVRPSSTEFFDALVVFVPKFEPVAVDSLSEMLTDQPWYFRSWRLDTTIQSSLTMLDAIHLRFKNTSGLFVRITNVGHPAITFQLLNLDNFGLSDDLYIKMNARGKPLTQFETFKARFEQALDGLFGKKTRKIGGQGFPVAEFFSRRMDTQWSDFFWPYRDSDTNIFDNAIMNLFRTVILITRSPENDFFIEDITLLRNKSQKNVYTLFNRRGWLDLAFSEALILLLEAWSGGSVGFELQLPDTRYFDEKTAFLKAVKEPTSFEYEEIVQLTGYVLYMRENVGDTEPAKFKEWMRIVFNLCVNTEYNRPADLQRSLAGLQNLAANTKDILEYFAKTDKPAAGFSMQQVSEEKLKAQLIVERPEWRALIDRAEGHGYFRGQIEFLLDFSGVVEAADSAIVAGWDDAAHLKLEAQFSVCLQKAEAMFTSKGLNVLADCRWERALLCIGDYLLPSGRRNFSFLVNSPTDQASWKRLLRGTRPNDPVSGKRKMLCQLWNRLDGTNDLTAQLDAIIAGGGDLEPWRYAFVRTPTAISYCSRGLIRWNNKDEVYLLQTTQMNGRHAELFTYCLYDTLTSFKANGRLKLLNLLSYQSRIGTDVEPGISIEFLFENNMFRVEIEFNRGQFIIYIPSDKATPYLLNGASLLESLGFAKSDSPYINIYIKESTPDLIESTVLELCEKFAATSSQEQNND